MRSSLLLAGLIFVVPVCADEALVARWSMDSIENGIMADATGNGHDATFFSTEDAQAEFAEGMAGKAIVLKEKLEQGFTVAKSDDFNFAGPFTVMAWVKPSKRGAAFSIACMKGDKSGEPPWPGWRLRYFWTRMVLQLGTPEGKEPSVTSPEWSVPVGYWSHVAASWDGKMLRAYVNGVENAATEFEGTIAPQPTWRPLILGNYIGRKNAYAFDGLMDEVRIYSAALDENAIFQASTEGMK